MLTVYLQMDLENSGLEQNLFNLKIKHKLNPHQKFSFK